MTNTVKPFLSFGLIWIASPVFAAGLRAGASKVDITPNDTQWLMGYNARQSNGVHDRIFHRVLALDDGQTQFYLISSDLCLFSPSVYQEVANRMSRELGIPSVNIWWSVSHSHATPEVGPPEIYKTLLGRSDHEWNRQYAVLVEEAAIKGIKEAKANLVPARMISGTGVSFANINRRAKDIDGAISLGLNPDGPADRQIGLLRFERMDGTTLAVVANYAMHGTVMSGANLEISGDAPGVVASYVEEVLGTTVLYVNGAAGNMAPIYSVYPGAKSGHLSEFRVLLGNRILAGLKRPGSAFGDVTLHADEIIVETPRKPGLEWPAELAAYTKPDGSFVRLPVSFLQLGDTVIWSAPVELFCEIATYVRDHSPFTNTFYFGYTNGWIGYLPTAEAFVEGGYEPKTSVFTGAAEQDVKEAVVTHLHSLRH